MWHPLLLGFCLPLASAIANSDSLADVAIWGVVALLVQIVIFFIVRLCSYIFVLDQKLYEC